MSEKCKKCNGTGHIFWFQYSEAPYNGGTETEGEISHCECVDELDTINVRLERAYTFIVEKLSASLFENARLRDALQNIIDGCDANMPDEGDIILLLVKNTAKLSLKVTE